jgi:hypothetical protein
MRIKVRGIREPGVPEKERLVLEVLQDDDVGHYAVFSTRLIEPDAVSFRVRRAFWFPDQRVRPGDLVVLYTKRGRRREKKNKDESTSYFFYWNQDAPLWGESDMTAVLVSIEEWDMVKRNHL